MTTVSCLAGEVAIVARALCASRVALAPTVPDAVAGIEDERVETAPLEAAGDRETGLAAADDDGLLVDHDRSLRTVKTTEPPPPTTRRTQ